tara:strand:- start:13889 stop:14761 length:873 start_codon:yes stop_codon:yes gene_type:complete
MKNLLLTIIFFFWKILSLLPRWFHNIFSTLLGRLLCSLSLERNKFAKINIDLCFPELDKSQKNKLYKNNIMSSGSILLDTGVAWFWKDKRIKKQIKYKILGLDLLNSFQLKSEPILLFFKHTHHLELDTRILAMNSEIYGVERAHNSSKFEEIQSKGRLKSLQGIADRNNTISFIRWLKEGKTVLYAPDQDYGAKKSEIVSFFNIPAATISAPFKIINLTKCKPFFLDSFYKDDELILDIIKLDLDLSDRKKFLNQLNSIIEEKIRLNPGEYLWQHRRFKTTLGKKNIYK